MNNEIISFESKNNNRYFYDPQLREVFLFDEELYQSRKASISTDCGSTDNSRLTGKDVRYHLANINQITMEMTEKCNLNCLYCGYGKLYSKIERKGASLPFSYIRNILVYLNEKMNSPLNISDGNPFYISFYGGEPLLEFDNIQKTVDLTKQMTFSNNKLRYSMTTNGFYLDKYMDYLEKHNFRLLISLDGDADGNGLRVDHGGKSQFQKIFSNIEMLQSKHPHYFKKNVNFNAVLNKNNSVESITKFIEDHFGKRPTIASINPQGLNPGKIGEFLKIYSPSRESFNEADLGIDIKEKFFINHPEVKEVFLFLRSVCDNSFTDYASLLGDEKKSRLPTGTCLPFSKRMFVSANGAVLPCENVPQEHPLGMIDEHNVHIDPEKIAAIYNNAYDELSQQCGHCFGKDTCSICVLQMETKYKCTEMVTKKQWQERFSNAVTFIENNPELYTRLMKEVCVE